MDSLVAARLQMTMSLAFHMVYAAIGIGLPLLLVIAEGLYLRTGREHYRALARQWAKVIGLLFAVGAISGTALAFELGLLWPHYMDLLGGVVGHLFGLEGYAFFVEAIFIGLYLYGWDRLRPITHWLCGVVIAVSGALSGVLVLGVNSWMQQPVGFRMEGSQVVSVDPFAIFRESRWFSMAAHSTLACYASVAFAVAGWYAWRVLCKPNEPAFRSGLRIAMVLGGICAMLQPVSGDFLARDVFRAQPVKFSAMEGQFRTERRAPLRIGGWPDEEARETRWAIEIPGGLSFLATHDPNAEVPGLDDVPREDWPNVHFVHLAFQVMVGCGGLMTIVALWFWWIWWRRREEVFSRRWLLRAVLLSAPLGFLALEAGWVVTEAGRQPWIIQGVMRTKDAVTPAEGVVEIFYVFTALYVILGITVLALLRRMSQPNELAAK